MCDVNPTIAWLIFMVSFLVGLYRSVLLFFILFGSLIIFILFNIG